MKRQPKRKTVTIPKKQYEQLLRDQLTFNMLIEAINETRAEDQLLHILKQANIQSNL